LKSDVLMDPVLVQLVNVLLSQLRIDVTSTRLGFPVTIAGLSVPEMTAAEVSKRSEQWAAMKCPEQVTKAKAEQLNL